MTMTTQATLYTLSQPTQARALGAGSVAARRERGQDSTEHIEGRQ